MTDLPACRLGLALDDDPLFAALIAATRAAAADLGIEVSDVRAPADEAGLDRVLVIGRPARHSALLSAPLTVPRTVWNGESLPTGEAERRTAFDRWNRARPTTPHREPARIGRLVRRIPLGGAPARWRARVLTERLVRANLSELAWAADHGADLVVTSHDRAAILSRHGLAARVVPIGYHQVLAGPLTPAASGVRDLALISLGAASRHLRRGPLLDRFAADLGGPPLVRLDGVWGGERAALLRRARVLVDVHRVPGTFIGVRLVLALAAGVAVVTEPMPDARPFEPGLTHLEVPADALLSTARALAADEDRRRALVGAGQALLAQRLRLTDSVRAIIGWP